MIGIFSWFRGKDLAQDADFQALIATPEGTRLRLRQVAHAAGPDAGAPAMGGDVDLRGRHRGGGRCSARLPSLRPLVGGKPLSMVLTIQMFMLLAGALIVVFTATDPARSARTRSSAPA